MRDLYCKHLINAVSNSFDGVPIHSTAYTHDLLSRRTNIVMTAPSGTSTLACSYNARSEVTGVTIDTNEYAYIYDNIGNSLYTSLNAATNAYTVNNLNQYSSLQPKDPQPINLSYDLDGNMITNGIWSFTYDAENRMIAAYSNDTLLASNIYDHLSRRIAKNVFEITQSGTNAIRQFSFIYDGWNLIHERVAHTNGTVDEIEYVWGLDLSGTMQGASGAGGLLYEKRNGVVYIPCYDANGNITAYVDTNGTVRAYRQFDAFGNTVAKGGDMVDVFHCWFSTKYLDHDTGLYYYGYRYYSPMLQRWLNRDPIEEEGGQNLYGFCGNDSICNADRLGDSYGNPPSQKQKFAPDITAAVIATLADIENKFKRNWTLDQKCKACFTLFLDSVYGWDILPLYRLGYNNVQDFAETAKASDGEFVVQFNRKVYHASAVNYAMWGKANRLCSDQFGLALDFWNLGTALGLVTVKKTLSNFMAQMHEAHAFTIYGYTGRLPPVVKMPWVGRPSGFGEASGFVGPPQPYEWRWRPFEHPDDTL